MVLTLQDRAVLVPALEAACWGDSVNPRDVGHLRVVCRAWCDETQDHVGCWLRGLLVIRPVADGIPCGGGLAARLARTPEWATARLASTRARRLPSAYQRDALVSSAALVFAALSEHGSRATPALLDALVRLGGPLGRTDGDWFVERARLDNIPHAGSSIGCPVRRLPLRRNDVLCAIMRATPHAETFAWLARAGLAELWRRDARTRAAGIERLECWCRSTPAFDGADLVERLIRASGCRAMDFEPAFWRCAVHRQASLPALQRAAALLELARPAPEVVARVHSQRRVDVLEWLVDRFELDMAALGFNVHQLMSDSSDLARLQWLVGRCRLGAAALYRGDGFERAVRADAYDTVEWLTRAFPVSTDDLPDWRALFKHARAPRMIVLLSSRLGVTPEMLE